MTTNTNSVVAICKSHAEAGSAIKELQKVCKEQQCSSAPAEGSLTVA